MIHLSQRDRAEIFTELKSKIEASMKSHEADGSDDAEIAIAQEIVNTYRLALGLNGLTVDKIAQAFVYASGHFSYMHELAINLIFLITLE